MTIVLTDGAFAEADLMGTAVHEAAHAVVGWSCGYEPTGPMTLSPGRYFGQLATEYWESNIELPANLLMTLAGEAAQSRWLSTLGLVVSKYSITQCVRRIREFTLSYQNEPPRDDFEKAAFALIKSNSVWSDRTVASRLRTWEKRATEQLSKPHIWMAVRALADQLYFTRQIHQADLTSWLVEHSGVAFLEAFPDQKRYYM